MSGKDPWRGHRMLTEAEWQAKFAPSEPVDDAEVMRLWREAGLSESFLGNGGTNHRLVKFAELVRAGGVLGTYTKQENGDA